MMVSDDMKIKRSSLSLFLALVLLTTSLVSAISKQNEEIFNQLKRLNKPAVKSIKSSDGDIVDCVKLTDQPAFDHPLLKNHTIQLSPKKIPEWKQVEVERSKPIPQVWHLSGTCPEGTIPIRRTTKNDILRHISFANKNLSTNAKPISQIGNEKAVGYTNGGKYFGTQALLTVWNPLVDWKSEYSKTQIWVYGLEADIVDSIEAGWHVSPLIYHDNQTRSFVFWTNDKYKSGCYNHYCPGFVQVSKTVMLGGTIWPVSSIGGEIFGVKLTIWKDQISGDWWLAAGNEDIGYWPNSLFSYLQKGSSMIQWGGSAQNSQGFYKHSKTDMGSGDFPREGYGRAALISHIRVVDEKNLMNNPSPFVTKATRSGCYDAQAFYNSDLESHIYYGGPGRDQDCP
ncbi:hypothetical protein ACFE04_010505 [Oxalis oulophora]